MAKEKTANNGGTKPTQETGNKENGRNRSILYKIGFAASILTVAAVIVVLGVEIILNRGVILGKGTTDFFNLYPHYDGSIEQSGNYEIRFASESERDKSEAAVLKYYWSGDPKDTEIHPESINNGNTKITGIGYLREPDGYGQYEPSKTNFSIDLPKEKQFSEYQPGESRILDPKDHLSYYGIKPGTKEVFDEIEFHVFISREVEQVCVTFSKLEDTPDPNPAVPETEKKVSPNYLVLENEDGSVTFYRYHLFFECSEENKRFYADEDGRLCVRSSEDERWYRVDNSLYRANDDFEPFEMIYEGETEVEA